MTIHHLCIVKLSLDLTALIRSIKQILTHWWVWRYLLLIWVAWIRWLVILLIRLSSTLPIHLLLLVEIILLLLLAGELVAPWTATRHWNSLWLHPVMALGLGTNLLVRGSSFHCQKRSTLRIWYRACWLLLVVVGRVGAHVAVLAGRLLCRACLHYILISPFEFKFDYLRSYVTTTYMYFAS